MEVEELSPLSLSVLILVMLAYLWQMRKKFLILKTIENRN